MGADQDTGEAARVVPRRTPPAPGEHAEYYARYVSLVPEGDIVATLEREVAATVALLRSPAAADRADHRYAEGKWSVKQVVAHVCDAERVFAYRALRIGRGDPTPLESFDENAYAEASGAEARSLDGLAAEFLAVRASTLALLLGLPDEAWARTGQASGWPVSVRALAWIIAGHELHHRRILEERYLAG